MSQNAVGEFVNTKIWDLFCERFKSRTTESSYLSDIREFCFLSGKRVEEIGRRDAEQYYEVMQERVKAGKLAPITMTKKFRELHSFFEFAAASGECEKASGAEEQFYLYLKNLAKEEKLARSVPVEDMDALFLAAADDIMVYTILALMYRAGISSTEIADMKGEEDFVIYDDGVYAILAGRREPCYIPGDVWELLKSYMEQRERHASLFYNRGGKRLNTMYISRMMKKYCEKAGIKSYSAQAVRNSCAFNLFAYGADTGQAAAQMGRTEQQIRRYKGVSYRKNLKRQADRLVKLRVEKP